MAREHLRSWRVAYLSWEQRRATVSGSFQRKRYTLTMNDLCHDVTRQIRLLGTSVQAQYLRGPLSWGDSNDSLRRTSKLVVYFEKDPPPRGFGNDTLAQYFKHGAIPKRDFRQEVKRFVSLSVLQISRNTGKEIRLESPGIWCACVVLQTWRNAGKSSSHEISGTLSPSRKGFPGSLKSSWGYHSERGHFDWRPARPLKDRRCELRKLELACDI